MQCVQSSWALLSSRGSAAETPAMHCSVAAIPIKCQSEGAGYQFISASCWNSFKKNLNIQSFRHLAMFNMVSKSHVHASQCCIDCNPLVSMCTSCIYINWTFGPATLWWCLNDSSLCVCVCEWETERDLFGNSFSPCTFNFSIWVHKVGFYFTDIDSGGLERCAV